jgi:5-bromo-4-chloroindolyl phosphate hydrolysis protein
LIALPDGPRQAVAGGLAAVAFVGIYAGLGLAALVALPLAAAVYGALLLLIGRRVPDNEVMIDARHSAADVKAAARALDLAAARLRAAAEAIDGADAARLTDMAGHLASIGRQVARDPADFRATRRFVRNFLPGLVESVEAFAQSGRSGRPRRTRKTGAAARTGIVAFEAQLARIDRACLENDLDALEIEMDVLGQQMERGVR